MIKNVIFDLGEVLIKWNPRNLYLKVFDDEREMEYFLNHICSPEWNSRSDAGELFEDVCAELIKKYPAYEKQITMYYPRWEEMLGGAVPGSVQILRELKVKKIPVFALTNWSAQTFPLARKLFPFLNEFNGVVVSGEEKLIKPDPRIYRVLLERYNLKAEQCVFIDDNPANAQAARELGFVTIRFTSPENLRLQLDQLLRP